MISYQVEGASQEVTFFQLARVMVEEKLFAGVMMEDSLR